jgi:DNA-binding PadR family transcriptional regulator
MLTLARVPCPDAEYRDPDGGYKHYRRVQFCTGTRAVFRWVDRDAVNPLLVERLKTFNAETTAVVTDGGEPREVPDSTEYVELLSSRLSSRLPVTRNRDNRRGGQYQGMDPEDIAALGALGVLAEADGAVTARTVRERLRHNFGRFWADGYGALLPALSRLAETDPPAVSVAPEGAAATYAITDRGRERLRNLLSEPIPDPTDPDACPQFVLKSGSCTTCRPRHGRTN